MTRTLVCSGRPTRHARHLLLPMVATLAAACGGDGSGATGPGAIADHTPIACDHDVTAPVIGSVSASPSRLWPPNHELVPITVAVQATDNCSAVTSRIVGVASSEPVDGLGDGHTSPDWVITGPLTLLLRSERSGLNDGRTYTISVQALDATDNANPGVTTVFVPHDQGNGGRP